MRTDDFDFELPHELIALNPINPREQARLLVVPPGDKLFSDRVVGDLPDLLRSTDVLVLNDTRVVPAALVGHRLRSGGPGAAVSALLLRRLSESSWSAIAKPSKRLRIGDTILFKRQFGSAPEAPTGPTTLHATVTAKGQGGELTLIFASEGPALDAALAAVGSMPLPPYIADKRQITTRDTSDYQTVFARTPGAVAAPTAGLHITSDLIARLDARGIARHFVTLHVGLGTFKPVKAVDVRDHVMHSEWGEVTEATAEALTAARQEGRRIVAIGTTALRILETAARSDGTVIPFHGETDIFITPGYKFRAVDVLFTNFHLPRSTLLMLVSAFSGHARMQEAYAHAIAERYRFFSYGDAMLLER